MPVVIDITRSRRRRKLRQGSAWLRNTSAGCTALLSVLAGAASMLVAVVYFSLIHELPPVEDIESFFSTQEGEGFQAGRVWDRDREILLFELSHPLAADRRWLDLNPVGPDSLPQLAIQATLVSQDEDFWENEGYLVGRLIQNSIVGLLGRPVHEGNLTIAERLLETTLLSGSMPGQPFHALRRAFLAAELTQLYPKQQILTWYLNGAYYGNLAFGFDSAALVYFGKHADQLSLAETAMLAGLPQAPSSNPLDQPRLARERQIQVLERMLAEDLISPAEARRARSQKLTFTNQPSSLHPPTSDFVRYVLARLEASLGPQSAERGGLNIVTTLDYDLHLQAECALKTHARRLLGDEPGAIETAADGTSCLAAAFLPPLRPGDAGVDHNLDAAALVVIEPSSAEILSLVSVQLPDDRTSLAFDLPRRAGSLLYPYIYLTAFARGSTPGTMTLDIPMGTTGQGEASEGVLPVGIGQVQGPVRMRTALANAYPAAARHTLNLVGAENVLRTAQQMGVPLLVEPETNPAEVASGRGELSLLDLTYSYGILANGGRVRGSSSRLHRSLADSEALTPTAILRVEDAAGRSLYSYQPEERVVLSPQLAFLMTDALSDEAARWPTFGRGNPLEIGRPAGAYAGTTVGGQDNWTLGFTPLRVIGVWLGNLEGEPMHGIGPTNGAAPVWHAVQRYASRDLEAEAWPAPPGISFVDVCDPSGLLPTDHCPDVVREVFVQGTEPSFYDSLYQPFRINKETGKLATMFTPLELVEERVFLIPPPEAAPWADMVGIEQPPTEYDVLSAVPSSDPDVRIDSPEAFQNLRREVIIRGSVSAEGLSYYRLQYGQGLNPTRWVQIGKDVEAEVSNSVLGRWETEGLTGLYILQLVAVLEDGRVKTAAVPLMVDNTPPELLLVSPEDGRRFSLAREEILVIEVSATDDLSLARVEFFVDGKRIAGTSAPPFSTRWPLDRPGEHTVSARAYDAAGNLAETEEVAIAVFR